MNFFKIILTLLSSFALHNIFAKVSLDNVALTDITIIDANHQIPLANQTVLISHNIISDIFEYGSKRIPDSFNVLSMKGKYLLPGLIDSHVHMATDPSGTDSPEHT